MNISAATAFTLISRSMNKLLQEQLEPHHVEDRIWRILLRTPKDSHAALHPLSTIWGALAERARFEKAAAEQMSQRAAREWLALPQDDAAARAAYLDRWMHEELGYRRKAPETAAAVDSQQRPANVKSPLMARLPRNAHDADGARELVALGYPALAPVLPHLFQWLETSGSAVELVLRPFFAELGAPARDLACKALLHRNKPALKYSLLRYVLPSWPREVLATLPLEAYLYDSDAYGLDVWALKLMVEKRIPSHEGLKGLLECKNFKVARLEEHLKVLASLALPAKDSAS
jgi:hypothetical protein